MASIKYKKVIEKLKPAIREAMAKGYALNNTYVALVSDAKTITPDFAEELLIEQVKERLGEKATQSYMLADMKRHMFDHTANQTNFVLDKIEEGIASMSDEQKEKFYTEFSDYDFSKFEDRDAIIQEEMRRERDYSFLDRNGQHRGLDGIYGAMIAFIEEMGVSIDWNSPN